MAKRAKELLRRLGLFLKQEFCQHSGRSSSMCLDVNNRCVVTKTTCTDCGKVVPQHPGSGLQSDRAVLELLNQLPPRNAH